MDNLIPSNIAKEITWRRSTYLLESLEEGRVLWYNPVSHFHGSCSIDSWNNLDPYDGKYQ